MIGKDSKMDPYGRIQRNMTEELLTGASDGAIKRARPDTSNIIADSTNAARRLLSHVEGGYDWSSVEADKCDYCSGYVRGA
jgi:hypothetical protein